MSSFTSKKKIHGQHSSGGSQQPRQFVVDAPSLSPRRVGTFGPTATRHRNDHIPVRRATLDLLLLFFLSFFLVRKKMECFFQWIFGYYGTHSVVIKLLLLAKLAALRR
jgi:hypothetical protein